MTKLQYWLGWIVFWVVALSGGIILIRLFIINPVLNRLDALMLMGMRLELLLRSRMGG